MNDWKNQYFYDNGNLVCRECAVRSIAVGRPQCELGKPWHQKYALLHDSPCSQSKEVPDTITISAEDVP